LRAVAQRRGIERRAARQAEALQDGPWPPVRRALDVHASDRRALTGVDDEEKRGRLSPRLHFDGRTDARVEEAMIVVIRLEDARDLVGARRGRRRAVAVEDVVAQLSRRELKISSERDVRHGAEGNKVVRDDDAPLHRLARDAHVLEAAERHQMDEALADRNRRERRTHLRLEDPPEFGLRRRLAFDHEPHVGNPLADEAVERLGEAGSRQAQEDRADESRHTER
jgi:hypothetical protein